MMAAAREIDYEDATEYVPAAVTILLMPLTYSIADGIAFGFVAYAAMKVLSGRHGELSAAIAGLAALFILKFVFL